MFRVMHWWKDGKAVYLLRLYWNFHVNISRSALGRNFDFTIGISFSFFFSFVGETNLSAFVVLFVG